MWIEVEGLNISIPEKIIFENANLKTNANIIGIYSQNGIGKSTFFNAIYKYQEYSGSLKLFDKEIRDYTKKQISQDVSYVMQEPILFEEFTVKVNLKIIGIDDKSFNKYYNQFKVKEILSKKVVELSGGERQVISLVIGLSKQSRCLLLDEPFNNLSKANKQVLIDILKLEQRKVIIISHQALDQLESQAVIIEGRGFDA